MKETWRQQLRQKLADYEEPDALMSWEEVEAALDQRQPSKVVPLWFRRVAAAAVFLLIGGTAVLYLRNREGAQQNDGQTATEIVQHNASEQQGHEKVLSDPGRSQKPVLAMMIQRLAQTVNDETKTTEEPVAEQEETAPADTSVAETPDNRHYTAPTQQTYPQHDTYASHSTSTSHPLTAKLFFSNTFGNSGSLSANANPMQMDNNSSGYQPVNDPDNENTPKGNGENVTIGPGSESGTGDEENDKDEDEQANTPGNATTRGAFADGQTQQQQELVSHHQPIRFGLLLRYQLSERWALESGLTYTRLTADITRRVPGLAATSIDQSLNYIGIPLTASYLIYKSRHLGFYASGGAMVEKMVYGSRTQANSRQRVSIHPLQVSVHAGLGAEWRFIPSLSLFVEPGLGYYFDNHSDVPTFYQEHPLSFNLNLGLRFSFE